MDPPRRMHHIRKTVTLWRYHGDTTDLRKHRSRTTEGLWANHGPLHALWTRFGPATDAPCRHPGDTMPDNEDKPRTNPGSTIEAPWGSPESTMKVAQYVHGSTMDGITMKAPWMG